MPLYEEEKEFTSLAIPVSVKREDLARQYRIFMEDGRVLDVLADSAADAVAALQLKEGIIRITNMELEGKRMLEGHLLRALEESISTDISMESARSGIGSILLPEVAEDKTGIAFETMDLVQYVDIKEHSGLKDLPPLLVRPMEAREPTPEAEPTAAAQHDLPEPATVEEPALPEPIAPEPPPAEESMSDEAQAFLNEYLQNAENMDVVELDAPPEPEMEADEPEASPAPPTKELSPEEVRNLLSTKQDFS